MPAGEFWDSTPRIIHLTFKANDLRLQREHNNRAWLAWHVAVLPRMNPIPKLDDLLIKPRTVQTPEQMREALRMLARTHKSEPQQQSKAIALTPEQFAQKFGSHKVVKP